MAIRRGYVHCLQVDSEPCQSQGKVGAIIEDIGVEDKFKEINVKDIQVEKIKIDDNKVKDKIGEIKVKDGKVEKIHDEVRKTSKIRK